MRGNTMREISYRAFISYVEEWNDATVSRMYYDVQFLYDYSYENDKDNRHIEYNKGGGVPGESFGELLLDKHTIMMEYTGYKDTKDIKIYESDICKYFEEGVWNYGVIEWMCGGFIFKILQFGNDPVFGELFFQTLKAVPFTGDCMTHQFEVIGNIHEVFNLYATEDWLIAVDIAKRCIS